jgi:hypothetical protein
VEAETGEQGGESVRLGSPLGCTGAGDNREALEDDDRVLDEHGIGAIIRGRRFDDPPSGLREHVDIGAPLTVGEGDVHGGALEMGEEPLGEQRAR